MTSRVTLNVFSGRPNPTWLLTEKEEEELQDRLRTPHALVEQRPSGVFGGLGYRGFSITRNPTHPHGALSLLVHEGIMDHQSGTPNAIDGTGIEKWLLGRASQYVSPDVHVHVRDS